MTDTTAETVTRGGWAAVPRLGTVDHGRLNNLNLVRFVLASTVVLSHCYVLLDRFTDEPMQRLLGFNDLGGTAVLSFFFLSGYLIFGSALRSTPVQFIAARALRILPALTVVTLLCTFVLGPIVSTLTPARYFADAGTWRYLGTAVLLLGDMRLPGVYGETGTVNQPLWTLPAEWTMYVAMLGVCIAGTLWRGRRIGAVDWAIVAGTVVFTLLLIPSLPWGHAYKWMLLAALGALAYVVRGRIPLSIPLMLVLLAVDLVLLLTVPIVGKLLFPIALAYLLLVVSFHPALLADWPHRVGDYSYGVYICAWPFQQLVAPHVDTPLMLFAGAYPLTLIAAVASWHLVEKPSLMLKPGRHQPLEPVLTGMTTKP